MMAPIVKAKRTIPLDFLTISFLTPYKRLAVGKGWCIRSTVIIGPSSLPQMCPQYQLSHLHWSKVVENTSTFFYFLQFPNSPNPLLSGYRRLHPKGDRRKEGGRGVWKVGTCTISFRPPGSAWLIFLRCMMLEISTTYFNTCTIICWAVTPRKSFFPPVHQLSIEPKNPIVA